MVAVTAEYIDVFCNPVIYCCVRNSHQGTTLGAELTTVMHPCMPVELLSPFWLDDVGVQNAQRIGNLAKPPIRIFGLSAYLFQLAGDIA